MKHIFVFILMLLITNVSVGQEKESFPGVKKLMSEQEFRSSGLEQLTEEEIDALNNWLLRYTAGDAKLLSDNRAVKEEEGKERKTNIKGQFTGWRGNTRFYLANGEVWEQRQHGVWKANLVDPEITIYKNIFGNFNLKVVQTGRLIGVRRVK